MRTQNKTQKYPNNSRKSEIERNPKNANTGPTHRLTKSTPSDVQKFLKEVEPENGHNTIYNRAKKSTPPPLIYLKRNKKLRIKEAFTVINKENERFITPGLCPSNSRINSTNKYSNPLKQSL